MDFTVKTVRNVPTLIVIEDDVTCTLRLDPKGHETKTDGEDTKGLAKRIGYSYRLSVGQGSVRLDFLELIKSDMLMRVEKKMYTGFSENTT